MGCYALCLLWQEKGELTAKEEEIDPLGTAVSDYIDVIEGRKPAAEAQVNGEQELTNEQRRRVPYIVALWRTPCFLCDKEPPCSFFIPYKTDDHIAPWRIIAICDSCKNERGEDIYKAIERGLEVIEAFGEIPTASVAAQES